MESQKSKNSRILTIKTKTIQTKTMKMMTLFKIKMPFKEVAAMKEKMKNTKIMPMKQIYKREGVRKSQRSLNPDMITVPLEVEIKVMARSLPQQSMCPSIGSKNAQSLF